MAQVNTESNLVSNTIADADKEVNLNQDNEETSNMNTSNKRPLPSTSDTAASPSQDDHLPVTKKTRSEQPKDASSSPATTAIATTVTTSTTTSTSTTSTIKPATSIFGSSSTSGFAAFGSSATPSSIFGSATTTTTGFGQTSSAFTSTSTGFGTATATATANSNSNSNCNTTSTTTTTANNASASPSASTTIVSSTTLPFTSNTKTEGFSLSTSTSNPMAGIFGSLSGNNANTTSIFTLGNSNENSNQESSSSSSPNKSSSSNNPIVSLPVNEEPVRNGEENEEAVITLRTKLFKLIKVQEIHANDRSVKASSDAHALSKTKKTGIQMATKVGISAEEADATSITAAAATTTNCTDSNANAHGTAAAASLKDSGKMDWKEVGIGPLRVLTDEKSKHTRIVQRRENTPGGQGTKLILNLALRDECQVERKGDKFVRLAAFEVVDDSMEEADGTTGTGIGNGNGSADKEGKDLDGGAIANDEDGKEDHAVKFESVQYLFKVKTIAEADSLVDTLARYCRSSAATKE